VSNVVYTNCTMVFAVRGCRVLPSIAAGAYAAG
jgi:hypothetical protein